MRLALALLATVLVAQGETDRYELRGRLVPGASASVWLHGATSPFEDSTLADESGHFRFRDLLAGTYTLGAFVPGRGEMRRTIEVGPSQADAKKRISLTLELHEGEFESRDSLRRGAMVSVKELSIPEQARHEYDEAERKLAKRDVPEAVAHLQRAVELAPQFAAAWNHLGTIAYQTRDYPRAESCFRKALDADAGYYQALVNLGGVLLNLSQFNEALKYNLYAALTHPNDALANSQLGMNYFFLNQLDPGEKYLTTAKRLDPAHFSHPQLTLAEIHLRRRDPAGAASELQDFLQQHPDSPEAGKIREKMAQLRTQPDPAQAFAGTGMARSYSTAPELPAQEGGAYKVVEKEGGQYLESRDVQGQIQEQRVDATIGSGRHLRLLLSRSPAGVWGELPVAWYAEAGGHYAASPGFGFSVDCLGCHAGQEAGHPAAIDCRSCHAAAGAAKPDQTVCMNCHLATSGQKSAHGVSAGGGEERFELNSATYRLLQSRCYQKAAGKLSCKMCHPAHGFGNTAAGFRAVCRSCHPVMHNGAALDCTRCHMPKRPTEDAGHILVTDHRIQRPL